MPDRPRPHRDPERDLLWKGVAGRCARCGDPLDGMPVKDGMHAAPERNCHARVARQIDYRSIGVGSCYLYRWWRIWDLCSGRIEKDHVVELADNGRHDLVLPACRKHHLVKTTKSNRARNAAKRAAKDKTEKGHRMRRAAALLVLAVALADYARWWWLGQYAPWDQTAWAWWCAIQAAIIIALVVAAWQIRARHTRLELIRIELANLADSPLTDTKLRTATWDGDHLARLDITFAKTSNVAFEADRVRFRNALSERYGGPWDCTWTGRAGRDRIRLTCVRGGGTNSVVTAAPTDHEQSVRLALSRVMTSDYTICVTDHDNEGPTRVGLDYGGDEPDTDDAWRAKVVARVASKLPGRWRADHWQTETNHVDLIRRPKLPTMIPHPATVDGPRTCDRIRFGLADTKQTAVWDLKTSPHMLVVGSTGGGKTVFISTIATEWLASGGQLVIIDGKGSILAGFRNWPGVTGAGLADPIEMSEAVGAVETLMRDRYRQVIDDDRDPATFQPVLLVIDEAAEFAINITRWWKREGKKEAGSASNDAPALDSWESLARLGRECRVHLVIGVQQAAAKFFRGTEARENLQARVACGPIGPQGAGMAFGSQQIGRDVPKELKGRMTVQIGDESDGYEVQGWWTPTPRPSGAINPDDRAILEPLHELARRAHPAKATAVTVQHTEGATP